MAEKPSDDPNSTADGGGTGPTAADGDGELDRTRLLRAIIVLAIGVPILIEAVTLAGLVGGPIHGDGNATATPAGVGVGDEFLPETPANETVTTASVTAGDDGWQFVLAVAVENVSNRSYELALTAVRTSEGTTRAGTSSTGPIGPGGSGTVTATWRVPAGEQPSVVTARVGRGNDPPATYQVRLTAVPVQS